MWYPASLPCGDWLVSLIFPRRLSSRLYQVFCQQNYGHVGCSGKTPWIELCVCRDA